MTLISTTTLSGASTTITVGANDYIDLMLYLESIDMTANDDTFIRINGIDSAGAYELVLIAGLGASTSYSLYGDESKIYLNPTGTEGLGSANDNFTTFYIPNANSTIRKNFQLQCGAYSNNGSVSFVVNNMGTVASSAVISSISVHCNSQTFSGGTAKLYGVK